MNEVKRLQEHMLLIRKAVGWTAEEFGRRIGVTRQTVNNPSRSNNNQLIHYVFSSPRAISSIL